MNTIGFVGEDLKFFKIYAQTTGEPRGSAAQN